ncbi:unnamed protein product [Rodentolepis nana]|uniref:Uncharacterized protein n=1 Tax=Rodentolepis nana TaxID=102285 RepID=A0A0R3T108_RODNA|nr:unnamed protein product [Rodentolepis nana]
MFFGDITKQENNDEYADNQWIEQLVMSCQTLNSDESVSQERQHPRLRQICLADRYFTTRYFPNVTHGDFCIMQHSNRICVIGLAPGHWIFSNCLNNQTHNIIGVDFQLNDSFNLLQCKVSGRRKRGSHKLQQRNGNHCLGYAVCDRGERHALFSGGGAGLSGRLYESNSRLSIKLSGNDRVSLAPIGHTGNNAAYLAVIMPPRTKTESSEDIDIGTESILTNDGFVTGGLTWDEYKVLRGL